ncbi:hypothetical protein U6A24_12310 [Aquimarina gracilis]|uniref:Lipoprotein n=1 Tax=Aquimarina gracilis TaxID=874422 RepID=A0ABU5ZWN2_9FLAO|nr:hypothetical protein [Aquimarina gracilis]MEB3346252.1 hypothetical protein [Aquimarina gracilis]
MKNSILNNLLLFLFIVALIGCAKDDEVMDIAVIEAEELRVQRQLLNESVAFLINTDSILAGRNIETVELVSFDSDYKKLDSYDVNGKSFVDSGEGFDAKKGDGIYTAQVVSEQTDVLEAKLATNENFKYEDRLDGLLEARALKIKIKVTCRATSKPEGESFFGFSCEKWGGCVEVEDCTVEIEIES